MTITIDVSPQGIQLAVTQGPFDKALDELIKAGYEAPISLYNNSQLRIQQGKDSSVSRSGNWVREDAIYVPNKGNFLTKSSLISASPKEATEACRREGEFYLTPEQLGLALQGSIQFPSKFIDIPTKRFNSEELTIFAFGNGDAETAQTYGDFLKEAGIKVMPVYLANKVYVNEQKSPFARKIWFGNLDSSSVLDGDCGDLRDDSSWVRGVLHSTGEASA